MKELVSQWHETMVKCELFGDGGIDLVKEDGSTLKGDLINSGLVAMGNPAQSSKSPLSPTSTRSVSRLCSPRNLTSTLGIDLIPKFDIVLRMLENPRQLMYRISTVAYHTQHSIETEIKTPCLY